MKNWKNVLISPDTQILNAIEVIDKSALQIAIVVDEGGKLAGTVTDGDIRRGLLKGITLQSPVKAIMNGKPTTVRLNEGRDHILSIMKQKQFRQIPVVDDGGHVLGIEILDELIKGDERENWVVLMAGGLGTRLSPLTDEFPKPLLKVGKKPILETILESFVEHGFHKFYMSVNYKANMLEDYFGDGSRWGAEIRYLKEGKRLGTAGCLGLLPEKPKGPLFVMNGDLLTKVNFRQLMDFHEDHGCMATMCVREYDFQVPYGVVKIEKQRLVGIDEKPVQRFFVSAGIYVVEPAALEYIPHDTYFDMPSLFERLIQDKKEVTPFPVREYWLDIGRMDDFEKANGEYSDIFE